jgi:hypothetical protein
MHRFCAPLFFLAACAGPAPAGDEIVVKQTDDHLLVETDRLSARINTRNYVSGTAAGGLLDRKTGARDVGFGLHIMDFLLGPGKRDDGYMDARVHGKIEKHYVEGPQICTKARELKPEIIRGKDFLAVRFHFTFTKPGKGYKAGSTWEQTLLFQQGLRYYFSAERITSVNDHEALFYRIDMPGHIKHKAGDTFTKIWLSYEGEIPASDFTHDFAPDEGHLYQRREGHIPQRMIRAYQVRLNGKPGPWMAGMTLDPAEVSEAWCHQRGYVCLIEELHMRPVKAGESFGAAYIVGWFDDLDEMKAVYDKHKGATRITLAGDSFRLE